VNLALDAGGAVTVFALAEFQVAAAVAASSARDLAQAYQD
tara:strand:- start:31 stop:150 length:120 start_codon:yes stop_codon:yes gene_type:complete